MSSEKNSNTRTGILRMMSRMGCAILCVLYCSCARMGAPDGGWFDDTPPHVVDASPADKSVSVKTRKMTINFDEYIKLADVQEKVVISPPQIEIPEIKTSGKRIVVELKDSLKENTTYTIDFSDAISDSNEGNPMGNYTYSFSTGAAIDTFEVSGYVLDASNLEPIKGILVGLYNNLSDTVFQKEPMSRISRTDGSGHFVVKGVAPGKYRAYALKDADGDFVYGQKSEQLAFSHQIFEPSWKPDVKQDTIWKDSLHIDNIVRVPYTHFLPDDITLLAFTAAQTNRVLIKTERQEPEKLGFYFSYGDVGLPTIRGLNFDADSAFIAEPSQKNDTVFYWIRDTALIHQDTLRMEVQYMMTDTTDLLISKTDTLELLAKIPYEKRLKAEQKELEQWQKDQEKLKKRGEPYDSIRPRDFLKLKFTPSGALTPDSRVIIEAATPLEPIDTAAIHLYTKMDSTWYNAAFQCRPMKGKIRQYELTADWKPGGEYSLEIDSAAISDIYGNSIKSVKQGLKVKSDDDLSSLMVNLSGIQDTGVVVQLLNTSDAVVRQVRAINHVAEFYYVNPGEYYLRAFVDRNGNGVWDTGDYDIDQQAEEVYYYNEKFECKAKWDVTRSWNLTARPRFRQKPGAITKQKPDQQKKLRNRNEQRAKELGKEYIRKTTGMRL
jgi:uncharacterized protein (DUF2141 family)